MSKLTEALDQLRALREEEEARSMTARLTRQPIREGANSTAPGDAGERLKQSLDQLRTLPADTRGGEAFDELAPVDDDGRPIVEAGAVGESPGNRQITRLGGVEDVAAGAVRGGIGAVNETVDLAAQAGRAGADALWANEGVRNFLDPRKDDFGGWLSRRFIDVNRFVTGIGFIGKDGDVADLPMPEQSDATLGRVTEGISQTVVGFVAGGRVLKGLGVGKAATTGGKIVKGAAQGMIGDFMAFDGNEERLSNLIESVPELRNPVTAFLAADEESPELAGRLKNTLEGLGVGSAFEGLLAVLRGTKALRRGDRAGVEAASDDLEAALGRGEDEGSVPPTKADDLELPREAAAEKPKRRWGWGSKSQPAKGTVQAQPPQPEIPPVVMSREDASAFIEEVKVNRESEVDLDIKLAGSTGAERDLAKAHGNWHLSAFGNVENLDATMRAVVARSDAKVVRSDADLQRLAQQAADELSMKPEEVLAAGYQLAGVAGDIDLAVQTMRTLWKRTAESVDGYVGRDMRTATDEEFANVVRTIHNSMVMGNYMGQVKSAMGRGLRVFQLPDADAYARLVKDGDPEGVLKAGDRGMKPLPVTREDANDWLEVWGLARANGTNPADLLNSLPGQFKYFRNSLANIFTANILSGPRTIALNVIGPSVIGALRSIEKVAGSYPASIVESLKGNTARAAQLRSTASSSVTAYVQTMGDVEAALRYGVQAMQQGRLVIGGRGSVADTTQQFGPLTERLLRAAGRQPGPGYWAGNLINLWPRAFAHLNNGLDEFSKRLAYLGEVRAVALVDGAQQGLSGDALARYVKDKLASSTDEVGAASDAAMLEAAERTTLTGTPGSANSFVRKGANLVNTLRREFPESRFIIPIFNVPANALGETLRRVPVLNVAFKDAREELMGMRGAVAQAEAYGRTLMGGALLWWGFGLARSGNLTGAGPTDPADRKAWLGESAEGGVRHRPWSIRIGDNWFSYEKVDVLGSLLGIVASTYDTTVYQRQDQSTGDQMLAAVSGLAEFTRDRAALQTISDLLAFGSRGQNTEAQVERFFGNMAGRLVIPNFVTQLGRQTGDPYQRVMTTWTDHILNMIPQASRQLAPQRNVFGEPILHPYDSLAETILPITYSPISAYEEAPELDELERLYTATGSALGVPTPQSITGGHFDAREFLLENGQPLFDAIVQKRMTVEVDGYTLKQALADLFSSSDYQDGVDADASNKETIDGLISRGWLVSQVFQAYQREAVRAVAEESPRAARALAVAKLKRVGGGGVAGYSADDLITKNGLLEALGIDILAYEDTVKGY